MRRFLAAAVAGCAVAPRHQAPGTEPRLEAVVAYLQSQVDSAFPGAVIAVGSGGRLVLHAAVGHYAVDDPRPVDTATVYDLASLTKVVGLTTASMMLVHEGKLELDAPVQRYVPAFRGDRKERVTIRHLLAHASGLPAWRPLFTEATTRATALALVDTTPLTSEPGAAMTYSDLGAIVLTQAVEAAAGRRLDTLLAERLFGPLGMRDSRFTPPDTWHNRIAPTERSQQGVSIRGTVHDENAFRLGGVSGHAGLFATARDLSRFGFWLLDLWHGRLPPVRRPGDSVDQPAGPLPPGRRPGVNLPTLPADLVQAWTRRQELPSGSSWALGWDTPSGPNSSAGRKLSGLAFGHTGFTGTSIWFDPAKDLFIILLTNRVNPTRENTRIGRVRGRVADLVVDALTERAR